MFLEPAISRNQYQGVTKCQLEKVKVENETNWVNMDTISVKNNCTLCDSLRSLWTGSSSSSSSSLPSSSMSMSSFWPEILISDFNSKMSSCFYHYLLYPIKAGCLCLSEWQSCELDVKQCVIWGRVSTNFVDIWGNFPPLIASSLTSTWTNYFSQNSPRLSSDEMSKQCNACISLSLSGFDKRASES